MFVRGKKLPNIVIVSGKALSDELSDPHSLTDDIRLPFELGEKRKLRAARGSGITATTHSKQI